MRSEIATSVPDATVARINTLIRYIANRIGTGGDSHEYPARHYSCNWSVNGRLYYSAFYNSADDDCWMPRLYELFDCYRRVMVYSHVGGTLYTCSDEQQWMDDLDHQARSLGWTEQGVER